MNNESKVVIVIHFSYLTIFFFPWEKFWPNAGELQTWPRYPGRTSCGFTSNITFFVMFVISHRAIISKQPHQVDTSWYRLFGKWGNITWNRGGCLQTWPSSPHLPLSWPLQRDSAAPPTKRHRQFHRFSNLGLPRDSLGPPNMAQVMICWLPA